MEEKLRELIAKWRIALSREEDCGYDHGIDDARRECADELEQVLERAQPATPPLKRCIVCGQIGCNCQMNVQGTPIALFCSEREIEVLKELCTQLDISSEAVLRQGLRLVQLNQAGKVTIESLPKMAQGTYGALQLQEVLAKIRAQVLPWVCAIADEVESALASHDATLIARTREETLKEVANWITGECPEYPIGFNKGLRDWLHRSILALAHTEKASPPRSVEPIPVNDPTCNRCGKIFLDCKCGQIHSVEGKQP